MRYNRISADSHIDLCWLPPDLFTSNARAELKERVPRVVDGPDGPYWTSNKGYQCGLVCGVGPSGQKLVPGQNHRVDRMAEAGLYDDAKRGIRRVIDPHLRVKDAELDGVDAEVIFGILGAATRLGDREAAEEMFRIYNDWLADFCSPTRAARRPRMPALRRRRSRREGSASRCKDRIARPRAVLLVGHGADVAPGVGAAHGRRSTRSICRSTFTRSLRYRPAERERTPKESARAAMFTRVSGFQLNLVNILAAIIGAAVLERYPRLRISFGESGIGWIPCALERMDFEWEDRFAISDSR